MSFLLNSLSFDEFSKQIIYNKFVGIENLRDDTVALERGRKIVLSITVVGAGEVGQVVGCRLSRRVDRCTNETLDLLLRARPLTVFGNRISQ